MYDDRCQMKQHAIMYITIMCKMMDEAVTCARLWHVKRKEDVYYTTTCMMSDDR